MLIILKIDFNNKQTKIPFNCNMYFGRVLVGRGKEKCAMFAMYDRTGYELTLKFVRKI